ncbi:MAG: quinol:electron acceptor oxidoreductase subunit ActD [Anaerolineae bacterium]
MSNSLVLMGLFRDPDPTADTLEKLRDQGIDDNDIVVISGVPYPAHVLGRPMVWERLPWISLSGAFVGFLIGVFLNAGTPLLYTIRVGGQAIIPIPPTAVITYEFTMLGLIVSTFLGVLWQSVFPSYGPKYHHRLVTHGRIGILFRCPAAKEQAARAILEDQGAEQIYRPERRPV